MFVSVLLPFMLPLTPFCCVLCSTPSYYLSPSSISVSRFPFSLLTSPTLLLLLLALTSLVSLPPLSPKMLICSRIPSVSLAPPPLYTLHSEKWYLHICIQLELFPAFLITLKSTVLAWIVSQFSIYYPRSTSNLAHPKWNTSSSRLPQLFLTDSDTR